MDLSQKGGATQKRLGTTGLVSKSTIIIVSRRGSRIFERGGGVQARIQDFSQAPPPWTLSA